MLTVYTSYNCSSCKKAMSWLSDSGIHYEEYNFFSKGLTEQEILFMLKFAHNGFDDIVSERSSIYNRHQKTIEDMSTHQLIDFIIEHPAILKRPLIVDDVTNMILIGFNKHEMENLL